MRSGGDDRPRLFPKAVAAAYVHSKEFVNGGDPWDTHASGFNLCGLFIRPDWLGIGRASRRPPQPDIYWFWIDFYEFTTSINHKGKLCSFITCALRKRHFTPTQNVNNERAGEETDTNRIVHHFFFLHLCRPFIIDCLCGSAPDVDTYRFYLKINFAGAAPEVPSTAIRFDSYIFPRLWRRERRPRALFPFRRD